ncbi:MAG: hypothetical protein KJ063_02360 [Anaerolineae bacterium]|nr:hypothetical protein [Anaerolineae bacterium]
MTTSFTLYQPLKAGTAVLENQLAPLIWPTYRRQSVAMGGDFAASFQFAADDVTLERWRDEYLAAHFVEYFGPQVSFAGLVHTLRLTYNGQFQMVTLDHVYNKIAVRYKTDSSAAETTTSFATHTASIARYGTRQIIVRASEYMTDPRAAQYRSVLLNLLATPRVLTTEVAWRGGPGVLQVDVHGYIRTLDWQLYVSASKGSANASAEVTNALTGADYVTAGSITTNTAQEVQEGDYIPAWQRIRKIAEHGDASGNAWLAGCYQGRALNYWQPDEDNIAYRYNSKARRPELRRVIYDANGAEVPGALVLPGRVIFSQDMMAGVPTASPLLDDPRAMLIDAIDFSRAGIALRAAPRSSIIPPPNPAEAVKVALAHELMDKQKRDLALAADYARAYDPTGQRRK